MIFLFTVISRLCFREKCVGYCCSTSDGGYLISFKQCSVLLETLTLPLHSTGTIYVWHISVTLDPTSIGKDTNSSLQWTPGLQQTPDLVCFSPGISQSPFLLHTSYLLFVVLPPSKLLRPSDAVRMDSWPPFTQACNFLMTTWVMNSMFLGG